MTPEQLKLLTDDERAAWGRCEKATTGPWHAMQANARTDLPAALEEIARLRAKIAHLDALGRRRKRRLRRGLTVWQRHPKLMICGSSLGTYSGIWRSRVGPPLACGRGLWSGGFAKHRDKTNNVFAG